MTAEPVRFDTAIPQFWGHWPATPERWSYSSLKDIEACPRRWMLSRAHYPEISEVSGYPAPPHPAAVFGDVVHLSLELLIKALVRAGCSATRGAEAVAVYRELGGYTSVVEKAVGVLLDRLEGSPSVTPERLHRLRTFLTDRVPEARVRVQSILGRTELPEPVVPPATPEAEAATGDGLPKPRRPLLGGAFPEAKLIADDLRLEGRVDLITVDEAGARVVDFKTGAEDEAHVDQVRIYALLWDLDTVANPDQRPTVELRVAYPARDHIVPGPDRAELRALEAATAARIVSADDAVCDDPEARPSLDNCQFCSVRHLCETYWEGMSSAPDTVKVGAWFDLEGLVIRPNGSRSWYVLPTASKSEVLLRTPAESSPIKVGRRVRVLGVRRDEEPDSDILVTTMTSQSDLYLLA